MDSIDISKLALPGSTKTEPAVPSRKLTRHNPREKFLKGPIPLNWLAKAAQLPGKACQISVVLWFLAGLNKNQTVALSNKWLREFGVSRYAQYRGLKALEEANLVTVNRHVGRNPTVTILGLEVGPKAEDPGPQ